MKKNKLITITFSCFLLISSTDNQAKNLTVEKKNTETYSPTNDVLHHIQDAHDWHLWGNVSIPLPIILYEKGEIE